MTLDGSIHCSARLKTLKFSMPLSHLRLLGCAGASCIVQGVHHLGWLVVQVYFTRGDVSVFCPGLHVLQCWMLLSCAFAGGYACAGARDGRVHVQCMCSCICYTSAASRYIVELVRVRLWKSFALLVFFLFFFLQCTILLRVLRVAMWTNGDDRSMMAV